MESSNDSSRAASADVVTGARALAPTVGEVEAQARTPRRARTFPPLDWEMMTHSTDYIDAAKREFIMELRRSGFAKSYMEGTEFQSQSSEAGSHDKNSPDNRACEIPAPVE